jgi:hypothetical protein
VNASSGQLGSFTGFCGSKVGEGREAMGSWTLESGRRRVGGEWCSTGASRARWSDALLKEGRAAICSAIEEWRRGLQMER